MSQLNEVLGNLPDKVGISPEMQSTLDNLPDQRPLTDEERHGVIRQAPKQGWWERTRELVNDAAAAFPFGGPDSGREKRLAKSGAVMSIVDNYAGKGIPVAPNEVEKNFDLFVSSKDVRPGVQGLGTRSGLTYDEAVNLGMGAAVSAGLVGAPVATLVGLAGFEGLGYLKSNALEQSRKAYLSTLDLLGVGKVEGDPIANLRTHEPGTFRNLRDFLPEDSSTPLKAIFDAAEFAALGKTLHGMSGPAKVAAKNAFEVVTHKMVTDIRAPESVYIAPEKIRSIFGAGDRISPEEADLVSGLGLTAKQYKAAMDYGLTIEVPTAKLVTLTERPWWSRVRQLFGITPYEAYTREISMGKAAGSVPVPALPEGTGKPATGGEPLRVNAEARQVETTTPEQSVDLDARAVAQAEAISSTSLYPGETPKVETNPIRDGGQTIEASAPNPDMAYLSMQNEAQARALETMLKKRDAENARAVADARKRFREAESQDPIAQLSKIQINYDSAVSFFGKQALEGVAPGRLSKSATSTVDLVAQEYGVSTEAVLDALKYSSKRAEGAHIESFKRSLEKRNEQDGTPFDDVEAETLKSFLAVVDRHGGLDAQFMEENYPKEIVAALRAGDLLKPGGVRPDVVMQALGYADETAMLEDVGLSLTGRLTAEQSIRAQLEMSDSIARYALDSAEYAAYLDEHARLLERMLNAPRTHAAPKILGAEPDTVAEIMVDEGEALEAALKRAERASREAFRAGDIEGALVEKERQKELVARARERKAMRQEVAAIKKDLEAAAANKKIPLDYQDQIAAIIDGVDIRRSSKTQRRLDSLGEFLARQEAAGEDISGIPQELIERLGKRPLDTFTMEELRALRDSVQMLEHLGGLKGKLIASRQKRDFETVVRDLAANIYDKANVDAAELAKETDAARFLTERPSLFGRIARTVDEGFSRLMMPQMIVRALDGFKEDGPAHEAIWWAQKHANDAELLRIEQHRAAMERILAPVVAEGRAFFERKYTVPGVRGLLTKNVAVSIALNSRRPVNIRHMVNGNKISPAEIKAVVESLEPQHTKMVEEIWDYTESLFPDVEANNIALTGKRLIKTEGRYYPAAIDWQKSRRGDAVLEALGQGNAYTPDFYVRPGTSASFRQAAVGGDQPLTLDLGVWVRHLMSEARDTTRTLAARDTAKLLLHPAIRQAIVDTRGEGEYRALVTWLKRQRDVNPTPTDSFDKLMETLRGNMTIAQLALNFGNVLVQPLSYLNVFAENKIGTLEIAKTFAAYVESPRETTQFVLNLSPVMRERVSFDAMGFDRELAELAQAGGKIDAGMVSKFKNVLMWPTVAMDRVASIPAWLLVYNQEFAKSGNQARAIDLADASVARTQSTSANLERPELLANKNAAVRMLTMFSTWANAMTNVFREQLVRAAKEPSAENIGALCRYFFWAVVVQQAITAPVKYGRTPNKAEVARDVVTAPVQGVPILKDFVNPLSRVAIGNPATPFNVTPLERLPQLALDTTEAAKSHNPDARLRAWLGAAELAGMLTGIPARPITNIAKGKAERRRTGKGNALNLMFPRQREPRR